MADGGFGSDALTKLHVKELTQAGISRRVSELGKGFSFKDGFLYLNDEPIGGVTLRRGNNSHIFMSPGIFKYGKFSVFINTGHEFVHAYHNSIGLTNDKFSEHAAYKWSIGVAKSYGQGKMAAGYQENIRKYYNSIPPTGYLRLPKWLPTKY